MDFLRRIAGRGSSDETLSERASPSHGDWKPRDPGVDPVEWLRTHPELRRVRSTDPRPTFAEAERLKGEEHAALYQPGIDAIQSMHPRAVRELEDVIRTLGEGRRLDAEPMLEDIWRTCPVVPIRDQAGHALRRLGSDHATAVLWSTRNDWQHTAGVLAVTARLHADPAGGPALAKDLLLESRAGDPNATRLMGELLELFAPSAFRGGAEPIWSDEVAFELLHSDPRWIELAAGLRRDREFGRLARDILEHAPPGRAQDALAATPVHAPVRRTLPRAVQPWLDRYLAGEHVAVWDELAALGPIDEPEIRAEAERVATETMRRVATAIDQLLPRLAARAYPLREQPRPDRDVDARLARLADVAGGPVPIALAAFWRLVDGVDLAPIEDADLPAWLHGDELFIERLDPLVVDPLETAWFSVEEWQEELEESDPEIMGPLMVDIAPDALHKMNISGGDPYAVELPDAGADPPIRHLGDELRMVPYLRRAIARGGFAGIDPMEAPTPEWRNVIAELTNDLPAF